ncbi:MAG: hypothetical protein MI920_19880 [Kiloniellales bacterium]|nr:hypothetical protein [Kiloniellales bacterium]
MTRPKIHQSFPLVQLAMPNCTLEAWQDYALSHLSPAGLRDSGILCAEDERGYILGLLVFQLHHDLTEGNSLLVKKLIVQDQFQSARRDVAMALIQAVEAMADETHCRTLHALVPVTPGGRRDDWLYQLFVECGHATNCLQLSKSLASTSAGRQQGPIAENNSRF